MNHTLHQLQREITSALDGLDAAQTQLGPRAHGKWTIQQIIEHLLLTYSGAETALNARLAKGRPTLARPTVLQHLQQFAVCKFGYFPEGRLAPPTVAPPQPTTHPLSGADLTNATGDQLDRLDVLCNETERLFGQRRFASHNVLGPLTTQQWRRFQLIHGRHHLKQIAAIRKVHSL